MEQAVDLICIGKVNAAHGIRGEVSIVPYTDEPQQFQSVSSLYVTHRAVTKQMGVEHVRMTEKKIIVKFRNIDDRTSAEQLRGALIQRNRSDLRDLADDEYFVFDLIGLTVKTVAGITIGTVTDVMNMPAHDIYVVKQGRREFLIPAIQSVIKAVQLDAGEMIIDPIDGLLE